MSIGHFQVCPAMDMDICPCPEHVQVAPIKLGILMPSIPNYVMAAPLKFVSKSMTSLMVPVTVMALIVACAWSTYMMSWFAWCHWWLPVPDLHNAMICIMSLMVSVPELYMVLWFTWWHWWCLYLIFIWCHDLHDIMIYKPHLDKRHK
jgi:hypothetical protein